MTLARSRFVHAFCFLLLSLFLSSITSAGSYAQSSLSGRVADAIDGQDVIGAAIQLLRKDSTQAYGEASDLSGKYSFTDIKPGRYILRVTYVGYTPYTERITIGSGAKEYPVIRLSREAHRLDAVTVRGRASDMRVVGDTLEFSAANFGTQAGATLEDLIKRIPGAEVDSEGKITINGKRITKMMIDGKDFFSGDTKVASKNIPASVIEKLQVLDKQSEMARLSGFDDGEEESVINIAIKPGQKKGLFGNAFAGYGTNQRYEANAMINRFTGDNQWTILAGSNNTNNMGFSDIASDAPSATPPMMGGNSRGGRPGGRGGATGRGGDEQSGVVSSSQIGGNAYFVLSPKVEMGGDTRYGYADQFVNTHSSTQNILPSGHTNLIDNTQDQSYRHNAGIDMKVVWKPDSLTELIYTPSLEWGKVRRNYDNQYSTTDQDGALLNEGTFSSREDIKTWGTGHRLDASRTLNARGRTISLSLDMRYRSTDNDGFYRSQYRTAAGATTPMDLRINNENGSSSYRARLSWVEPLGNRFFLQAMYNLRSSRQSADRTAFAPSAPGHYDVEAPQYESNYINTLLTQRIGLNVKKVFAKSDLTLGFSLDPSTIKSERRAGASFRADTTISRVHFSPMLRFSYRPDRNTSVRIGYRGWTMQPSIDQLMPVPDITTPLVKVQGNPNLRPAYWNNIMMRLQSFSPTTRRAIYGGLHAAYILDDIVPNTIFDTHTGERTTTYENVSGNAMLSLFGSFSSPFLLRNLSVRLATTLSYNHRLGFVNACKNISDAISNTNNASLAYQTDWLYASLKGSFGFHSVKNSIATNPSPTTYNYAAGSEIGLTLPAGFRLESDIDYRANTGFGDGFRLKQWLWNASLSYSFLADRAATVRLKVYDIFDQRSAVNRNASALSVSEERTNTPGRYAMLHFIYRFNIFSGGASKSDMSPRADAHPYR